MFKKNWYFLPVLLIEGAALMAVELMGAKLVAPFYGSSLYVWTAILLFTALGLSLGYYTGGQLSSQRPSEKLLFSVLGISAALVFALPYTAGAFMSLTSGMSLIMGICLTCLILVVPPLFCFGIVGPMVVRLMTLQPGSAGKVAGTNYFISTLSGIAATFLFGFWLIPDAGLKFCALITALALASLPVLYFILLKTGKIRETGSMTAPHHPDDSPRKMSSNKKTQKTSAERVTTTAYLFAVVEGATVMAVELMSARMLAPWFGSSLYVWGAVIGITLLSLAAGYYLGGRLTRKHDPLLRLYGVLLASSIFLMIMHFSPEYLSPAFSGMHPIPGVILVSLLLVFPPLVFLGMVPTLLIGYLSSLIDDSGQATGRVFTLSSLSGILALPVFGFWLIPHFGLTTPSVITGLLVGIVPFFTLLSKKKYAALLFIPVALLAWTGNKAKVSSPTVKVQYFSEGLLGQVLVADVFEAVDGREIRKVNDRMLYVNRMGQTNINLTSGNSNWTYLPFAVSATSIIPQNSNALLLGLGGGTVANMLYKGLQIKVDAVELDKRIASVAQRYFTLDPSVTTIVDDARHYIATCNKKYDLIFFDVFKGDIAPPHVLSLECFEKATTLLNKGGLIVVNFNGFLSGEIGKPGRSVYKTLVAAGMDTRILPTPGKEEERNSLFLASRERLDYHNLRSPLLHMGKPVSLDSLFLDPSTLDLKDAIVFVDDKPALDKLNIAASSIWRRDYNVVTRQFSKSGIPLYK
jgi:spermidine synthase